MADTGFLSPSAEGKVYSDFVNPTYAYSSNEQFSTATVTYPAEKNQDWYNFNFDIPEGATINGIQATVEYYNTYTPTQNVSIYSASADSEGTPKNMVYQASPDEVFTYGSATNKWGNTWVASDFSNDNFYLKVLCSSPVSGTKYLYIDHIQVKVYYTELETTNVIFDPISKSVIYDGATGKVYYE